MTTLESRYRWLLRVYPVAHRAAYEEEMVGVLMSGSPPGRRFPSPADALDLLRAGLTVRCGRAFRPGSGTGWRDAAAVTALLTALILAAAGVNDFLNGLLPRPHRPPIELLGLGGLLDPALRTLAWLAVGVAALRGRHRAAARLCAAAFLAELGAAVVWLEVIPLRATRLGWGLSLAILAGTAVAVAGPARPARVVLGRAGVALTAAAVALLAGAGLMRDLALSEMLGFWLPLGLLGGAAAVVDPPVRGRIVLLSAAMFFGPISVLLTWDATVVAVSGPGAGVTFRAVGLVLTPVAVVAVVAGGLRQLERFAVRTGGHVRTHE